MTKHLKKKFFIITIFILLAVVPFCIVLFLKTYNPPQLMIPYKLCDLDHNKTCDNIDKEIFEKAFMKCRGDNGYVFEADLDGDGCIVSIDKANFNRILEEK